ncbi:unnamed protein product [Xylocopa violacea]|uniref:Uncharacterized protein n=1 Tax=Xylocopa violacea TaxID=135666 RepID=A0ABP1NT55_XYLVO
MAKRKSLNRRLSRYTRHSVGSAILDPDTDNLGDEHPYWWENLENNTAIRPSDNFSSLNQTSRHLDSDSQVEASQAKDGWWKALEHSSNSNSLQTKRIRVEKATTKDVSTTESEEEFRIPKRKFPLRSKLRKAEGNAFLNVLNDSATTTRLEPVRATTTSESSIYSSSSSNKVDANVERSNGKQGNTLDQSQSENVTGILKLKPNIFRKNCNRQNKNVFADVLNENELENESMGISFTSSNESEIAVKNAIPAGTETVVRNRIKPSGTWSLQNQDGFLDFPVPKAQSTELDCNALSSSSSSSMEHLVFKPKYKFLTRNYTTRQENAFKDVLEEQGTSIKMDKSGSVNKNSAAFDEIQKYSSRSSKNSETLREDAADERAISSVRSVNETAKNASSVIQKYSLRSSKNSESLKNDAADERAISSVRSVNETAKNASSEIQKYSSRSSKNSETLREDAADERAISSVRSVNETAKNASSEIQKYSLRSSKNFESLKNDAADERAISSVRSVNETAKNASSESHKYSLRSSKNSETLRKDAADERAISSVRSVNETAKNASSEVQKYSSRSSKNCETLREDAADERAISSVRSVNETAKDALSADEASIATSNDTSSDADENFPIPKSKRRFLASSSKKEQTNKLKDLLEELGGVDVSSESKSWLNRAEERNSTIAEKKLKLNRDSRGNDTDLSVGEKNKTSIGVREITSNDVQDSSGRRKSKNLSAWRKGSVSRIAFEETRPENVEDGEENVNERTNDRWSWRPEDEQFLSVVNDVDVERVDRRSSRIRGNESDAKASVKEVGKSLTDSNRKRIPKGQTSIRNFFKSGRMLPVSQAFSDQGKIEEIRKELTRVKELELARMKRKDKTVSSREKKPHEVVTGTKGKSQAKRHSKEIHKAYLVNGQPWRAPKLPRPHRWITDRLYKHLWNCMEPKFKLETRIVSEKFIHQLSNVTTLIIKRESYADYRIELIALMKEMARLGIVRTRNDFYNFCHDFFPYELRVKTVPMLLPGNKKNIPYNAETLHAPLLDDA